MYNKIAAIGLLSTLGLTLIVGFLESAMTYALSDGLYSLAGLLFFVFGIWGAVLLLKK